VDAEKTKAPSVFLVSARKCNWPVIVHYRLFVRLFTDCLIVYILYYVYILMFRSSMYCTDVRLSCRNKHILLYYYLT